MVSRFSPADYKDPLSDGSVFSKLLLERGLRIEQAETAVQRQANAVAACRALESDFNDTSKWTPSKRSALWWVNQAGILLEIIGATVIVVAARRNRGLVKDVKDTWDGNSFEKLRDVVANQANTELRGFVLLAIGLLLQMIGGLGN